MSTTNPCLSTPELIKRKSDEVQNIMTELQKSIRMEMGEVVKDRDSLKKQVGLLEKTQRYTELQKRSVEEKLRRSEKRCKELQEEEIEKLRGEKLDLKEKLEISRRKCEQLGREKADANQTMEELRVKTMELEEKVEKLRGEKLDLKEKLENSHRKCEELSREKVDANETMEELKRKEMEGERVVQELRAAAELYQSRLHDTMVNVKVNLHNLVGAVDKSAAACANFPDFVDNSGGSGSFGLPKKEPAYKSVVTQSKGIKAEVGGASYKPIISRRCDLDIIKKIKKKLGKENLERFEKLCFGHLLKINQLKFQGSLVLQLLQHMDMGASNQERLAFKINNINIEFGPHDFSRITGLCFGTLKATPTSSSIHANVFQGRRRIALNEIKDAFLTASHDHEGRGELTLKLALLYFLYGVLLARNRSSNRIELRYLHLVEDVEKFNTFPWGRVAYDFLISSIFFVRDRMDCLKNTNMNIYADAQGLIFALQIWAYEMMPSVATCCASPANNFDNLTPQILRWSATKIIRFNTLEKFFTLSPGDKTHLKNSMVKLEEVSAPLSRPQQKKRKLVCEKGKAQVSSSGAGNVVVICDSDSESPLTDSDDECYSLRLFGVKREID